MRDANYTDDPALLANTTKAESLLHGWEQAAGSIGFYMKANKTVHVF